MLIVISPAKTLDFDTPAKTRQYSQPDFLDDAGKLVDTARLLSAMDIAELMKVSMKIAELNFERFQHWHTPFTPENAKQALLAFKGDVYTGLDAESLDDESLAFAQDHLRILSGLYGLLRPLDLMQPYRLEMGTRLENPRGKDLYAFWGERITQGLNRALAAQGDDVLVNLASNEYFKAVKPAALHGRIITPVFKEWRGDRYKIISFSAKKARGLMSRYIIENRLSDPEELKGFDRDGYGFNAEQSEGDTWVFTRLQG